MKIGSSIIISKRLLHYWYYAIAENYQNVLVMADRQEVLYRKDFERIQTTENLYKRN